MAEGDDGKKPPAEQYPQPGSTAQAGPASLVPEGQPPFVPGVPGAGQAPPVQPGSMPQLAGMMIQHGITVGQAPQNPVVMQYICNYLSHDSDNRLQLFEARGKRTHIFRLCTLGVVTVIGAMIFAIPLVALARGDMTFVKEFLDKYFQLIIIIVLALLGGGKLFDIVK